VLLALKEFPAAFRWRTISVDNAAFARTAS